jgi:hypothetical protein
MPSANIVGEFAEGTRRKGGVVIAAPPQLVFTAQDYRRLIEAADQIDAGGAAIKFAIDEWDQGANRLTRRMMRLDLGALESDATIVRYLVKGADPLTAETCSHFMSS